MKDWKWLRKIAKVCIVALTGIILLSASLNGGIILRERKYNEKSNHEYPLSDIESLQIDNKYIYCFNDMLFFVNVYDRSGIFQYSLIVPEGDSNGGGTIYLKEGFLCVKNRHSDVYQYKDGKFICRVLCDEEYKVVTVHNETDKVLYEAQMENDEVVGFFDGELAFTSSADELMEDYELTKVADGITYSVDGIFPTLKINGKVVDGTQRIRSFLGSHIFALLVFILGAIFIDRISDKLEKYFDKTKEN